MRLQPIAAGTLALLACLAVRPAAAQVRFGHGIRIGGHDFSNRRYRSVHVARVKRLPGPPGCRHLRNGVDRRGDGTRVPGPIKRCNLVAIPPRLRR